MNINSSCIIFAIKRQISQTMSFRTSIENKFHKNEDEKLMKNHFYSKQVENLMHEKIE
jgi:hypothetical protein